MAKIKRRLSFSTRTGKLKEIRKFVAGTAREVGFGDDSVGEIILAVDEAATNVIKHAYGEMEDREMVVEVQFKSGRLEISITDTGKGLHPEDLKERDVIKRIKTMKPGGLGIHLMRKMVDEVEFHVQPGVSNSVRLVKYLAEEDTAAG